MTQKKSTHWGWYWKVKKKHQAKLVCDDLSGFDRFHMIDSFAMYKFQEGIDGVRASKDRCSFWIPEYNLKAYLQDDDSLFVRYYRGYYSIPVEKKPCNFGGSYYFFHCPVCDKRMQKLYCMAGKYMCRKCGNLCYYTQLLEPKRRAYRMQRKVQEFVTSRAGNIEFDEKPPRMHKKTFIKLKDRSEYYDAKANLADLKQLRERYGARIEPYLDGYFEFSWKYTIEEYEKKYIYHK